MEGWYQSQVWHGAGTAARILGARLVGLIGSAFDADEQNGNPTEIFDLARSTEIDGYIVLTAGIANFSGPSPVDALLARLPPRPVVSIGLPLPGASAVLSDGNGIDTIARHLIETHGLKRMAFVGGPDSNADARRRWDDWTRTLAEYGMVQDPLLVDHGDFMPNSGKLAAERILDRTEPPDAFVCANDAMALGVRQTLSTRGFKVPYDILVTGYDDIEEAATAIPAMTSVRTGTYQMAYRAVEMMLERLRGAEPRTEIVESQLVVRRSCGCHSGASTQILQRRVEDTSGLPSATSLLQALSLPGTGFIQGLEEILDLAEGLELDLWEDKIHQVVQLAGHDRVPPNLLTAQALVAQARHGLDSRRRQELHYLMRVQFQTIQSLDFEIDRADIAQSLLKALRPFAANKLRVLLFRSDLVAIPSTEAFLHPFALSIDTARGVIETPDPQHLLPPFDDYPGTWATLSLALGQEQYGVVQVRDWNSNELFLESLRLSLTMVLSVFRKSARDSDIRDQLLSLSRRDELTGLLNRRGLLEQGEVLVRSAQRSCKTIGVVLCDLDGLKQINDVHGHHDGDLAIECLARSLEDGFRQSDVISRLGGDEFAVITVIGDNASLEGAIVRLREALERRSLDLGRPWTARTSAGWIAWAPGDGRTLEQILAEADRTLYRDKRARKGL